MLRTRMELLESEVETFEKLKKDVQLLCGLTGTNQIVLSSSLKVAENLRDKMQMIMQVTKEQRLKLKDLEQELKDSREVIQQ